MRSRTSDLVALGFLLASVVLLVLFHLLVLFSQKEPWGGALVGHRGWEFWGMLLDDYKYGSVIEPMDFTFLTGMVLGVLLVLSAPFLIRVLCRSRILWWMMALASGMMCCSTTGLMIWALLSSPPDPREVQFAEGLVCLLLYPLFNLIGLFLVRRCELEEPVVDGPSL